jgi:Xaa-Pro aminopeptidase
LSYIINIFIEKLEQDTAIVYRHGTTSKGENICAKITKRKSSDYIRVQVFTPVRDDFATRARFHKSEDEIELMSDAKRIARTYITEATTDIDKHLTEKKISKDSSNLWMNK